MLTLHLTGLSSNGYNCVEREHKDRELHHRCFNNHNQVAVHTHIYGVYLEEKDGLNWDYEKLWGEEAKVLQERFKLVAE